MIFKKCPSCGYAWGDREEFLSDSALHVVGYQANVGRNTIGYLLFHHGIPGCGTSLAVEAGEFADMHTGPVFEKCLYGTARCPGYCMNSQSLLPCAEECECAYVLDILQVVRKRLAAARKMTSLPVA